MLAHIYQKRDPNDPLDRLHRREYLRTSSMFPRIDYNLDPSQLAEFSELGISNHPANKARLERFLSHHPHHLNQHDMSSLFERIRSDLDDGEGDGDDEDDDYAGLTPTVERPSPVFPPPKQ